MRKLLALRSTGAAQDEGCESAPERARQSPTGGTGPAVAAAQQQLTEGKFPDLCRLVENEQSENGHFSTEFYNSFLHISYISEVG